MKIIHVALVIFLTTIFSHGANSTIDPNNTGQELVSRCEAKKLMGNKNGPSVSDEVFANSIWCIAYLQGFFTANEIYNQYYLQTGNKNPVICWPQNLTLTEVAELLVKYGKANRQYLSEPMEMLTLHFFMRNFRCK